MLRVFARHRHTAKLGSILTEQERTTNFATYGLDQIRYPVEIEDIPAIDEKLGMRINLYSFCDDGEGRHRGYGTDVFERTRDLL